MCRSPHLSYSSDYGAYFWRIRAPQMPSFLVVNVLLGADHPPHQDPERQDLEDYSYNSFDDLLGKLQQISSELAGKAPGGGNELKTTISILNKLSSCSWAEKAVLVIAAFALDYGDFWGLAQLHDSLDHLAESVGITNRVPAMSKRPDLKKCQKVIEVRKLIENTLEVIRSIIELEEISELAEKFYRNTLATETLAKCIPVHVFWAIITVVACTTQMYCLRSDEDESLELSPLSEKMNRTRNIQETQVEEFEQQRVEVDKYWKTTELPETPTKIVEAFKAMVGSCIIHGSTKKLLSIDVLKNKNVLLFISDVTDISVEEISILKPIFDGIREKDEPYKIVWIPIVEHWTDDMQAKFEMLQSNMPWYILQGFPPTVDITNEYCSLKNKPIVVVINPQWEVEHPNALRMIRLFGMKAFPFTAEAEKAIMPEGLRHQCRGFRMPRTGPMQVDRNYTFNYGFSVSSSLRERFTTEFNKICDYINSNGLNIVIEKKFIGEGSGIGDVQKLVNAKQRDPKKLLRSFKSNSGWVVLCKGTRGDIVVGDDGTTILKVLENFDDWKNYVNERGYDKCFHDYYQTL
ncbi:protein SIEVE ELEMENT OCCLUSION B-like [Juglans regia]|uniref:Protein SIEVE ELEMENT OCCLUSION B-like n=1 Tax=Juglans regia TaxID=51240 RepID=A0A6P9EV57_JUGRE|nr:protein SIEVE ELEMENT OCCLUSION B-like [Juglans regia]